MSFTLRLTEAGPAGQAFTLFVPCFVDLCTNDAEYIARHGTAVYCSTCIEIFIQKHPEYREEVRAGLEELNSTRLHNRLAEMKDMHAEQHET